MSDDDFVVPDWRAPLDLEAYIAAIPPGHKTRGLFMTAHVERLRAAGGSWPDTRYLPFSGYPVSEFVELVSRRARAEHPRLPIREAIRRVGWTGYPVFARSTLGKVIFTFAGNDPRAALRLAPRAYDVVSYGVARVEVEDRGDTTLVRMRDAWTLPSCHEVGVLEGGIREFGGDVEIRIRELGLGDVDMLVDWR